MKWREHFKDLKNIPSDFADKDIEVSDCLKLIDMMSFTIKELMDKSWHTGTPTEEGLYIVAVKCDKERGIKFVYEVTHFYSRLGWMYDDVLAWQRITPYEGQ